MSYKLILLTLFTTIISPIIFAANVDSPKPVEVVNEPSVNVENFPSSVEVNNFPDPLNVEVQNKLPDVLTVVGPGQARASIHILGCFLQTDPNCSDTYMSPTGADILDVSIYIEKGSTGPIVCTTRFQVGPPGGEYDFVWHTTNTETTSTLNYSFPKPLRIDETGSMRIFTQKIGGTGTCFTHVTVRYTRPL